MSTNLRIGILPGRNVLLQDYVAEHNLDIVIEGMERDRCMIIWAEKSKPDVVQHVLQVFGDVVIQRQFGYGYLTRLCCVIVNFSPEHALKKLTAF